jgi:acyl-homoserine-lactone acylase
VSFLLKGSCRYLGLGAVLTAVLVVASASPALGKKPTHDKKRTYHVQVVRDAGGIPHIRAKDFRSLGYGEGYSYAQDNTCLFEDAIVTVRGERSQFFGSGGVSRYYSNGAVDPNPKSDAFWKWVQATGGEKGLSGQLRKNARRLYHGWADGFNAFLHSHRFRDPTCKGQPWVRPITFEDLALRGLQIEIGASSGTFISDLYDAQPPGPAASEPAAAEPRLRPGALRRAIGTENGESQLGSNGLAFGSRGTKKGGGLLLANPHFPWRGVDRFWMAQLTVPGKYNALGGTLGGFPEIGIGFNRNMAWTHTVSTGRRFVVEQLKLAPGDPTSYVVDGQTIPMTRTTVNVNGQPHTFYGTRYGLVITIPDANYTWSTTTAYAFTDSNFNNGAVANQYLKMGRARSVRDLLRVERSGLGVPFFNTIAADSSGRALYADVGRYSNVPKSLIDSCTPAGLPEVVYQAARVITLDGSRSSCTPNGYLPASEQPSLIRRDYVENSNDSFWLANPSSPITGITPLIGLDNEIQGVRTRYGNLAVRSVLGGGGRFGIGSLQAMWESDTNYLAQLVSKQLAGLCRANPTVSLSGGGSVDVSEACPILDAYDDTGNLDSRGAWLFAAYWRLSPGGAQAWADKFNPADPLNTPNQLNTADPAQLQALGGAVQELRDHGIPLDSGMRSVQVATRGPNRISIHGCPDCFQYIGASNGDPGYNAPYGEVVDGSSMVLTTHLTKNGPKAQGILTYSQATDPTSPWFGNLTKRFSRKKWVKLAFTHRQQDQGKHGKVERLPRVPR